MWCHMNFKRFQKKTYEIAVYIQASHLSCMSSSKPASKHSFLDKCPRGWEHHNFSVCLALHNFKPPWGRLGACSKEF